MLTLAQAKAHASSAWVRTLNVNFSWSSPVIPGRRSEAEASPESITTVRGYGFRVLGLRPSPGMTGQSCLNMSRRFEAKPR